MKSTSRTVRSLRYKRSLEERVSLAVRHHVQKKPLRLASKPEAPTLTELAIAYDVSLVDIQRKLDEWSGHLENFLAKR